VSWHEDREADWLSVAEATTRIVEQARPVEAITVPLDRALGHALARDVEARATLPPFDNSAMDGYAVRTDDVVGASPESPARLRVRERVRAGEVPSRSIDEGEAVRIMTGAPVPPGCETVVRVEHTDGEWGEPGWVRVTSDSDARRHVRPGGLDMREGDVVLEAGTTVTPGVLAVAAAAGRKRVAVRRAPRVGILSSGDELRAISDFEDVRAGRAIPDTNGPTLAAQTRAAGGEPLALGIARDDPGDIVAKVERAFDCDVLVTTGGASMGEADLFKRVLVERGLEVLFWRVRIRPGSPFSFGRLLRPAASTAPLPVLGLPGNPASAFVTFELFARPFLRALAGHRSLHRRRVRATAAEPMHSTPRLTHYHRVRLEAADGGWTASLSGHQSSGLVSSLAAADGLGIVSEGKAGIAEGEELDVLLLG